MFRYVRLFGVQLRTSLLLMMQYRVDFLLDAAMSLFWTGSALVPLLVLFGKRDSVVGWSWPEALLVVAWFTLLKGILNGAIHPALQSVVEHIRKGTLDFVLLKPADAQFLVSTARFELWRGADVVGGLLLLGWALVEMKLVPSVGAVVTTAALLAGAVAILYSLWIFVISLAFVTVKVDNLTYLFESIYDAGRWPASIYRGFLSFLFTFVIPLALMTTWPALAILGRLEPAQVILALGAAVAFSVAARLVWRTSIRHYTSAGG